MTLVESDGDGEPTRKGGYVIFYASRDENHAMWCPDCRDVERDVEEVFEKAGVEGRVVYVGGREAWKTSENVYRKRPWMVEGVPTMIHLDETGEEIGRLREEEIRDKERLRMFVAPVA